MVLKEANFDSFLPHLTDGPERRLVPVSWPRILKELPDCALLAMVLKGVDEWSCKDSHSLLCFLHGVLPSIFKQGS